AQAAGAAPPTVQGDASSYTREELDPNAPFASKYFAHGTKDPGTSAKTFIVGEERVPGQSNPERIDIDYENRRARVTPLTDVLNRGIPQFAHGTEPTINTYDDSAFQNLPALQFLSGGLGKQDFNRISTGSSEGAFGTRLPFAGAINFNRARQVQKDPLSNELVSSLFRSGSRDFATTVARAKRRAPLGQAISTTLIRT
ncbi:hypothetical protein LCGC14_2066240, partial [marine sediment metagenome]